MKIAVDFDSVICQFDELLIKEIRLMFPSSELTVEDIWSFKLEDVLGIGPGFISDIVNRAVLFGDPKPIAGAIAGITHLYEARHEIVILTSRGPEQEKVDVTKAWLAKYYVPYHRYLTLKGWKAEPEHFDVMIDDNISKLLTVDADKRILFSRPWNFRTFNVANLFVKVVTWEAIVRKVEEHGGGH